jgi:hypothetical protein
MAKRIGVFPNAAGKTIQAESACVIASTGSMVVGAGQKRFGQGITMVCHLRHLTGGPPDLPGLRRGQNGHDPVLVTKCYSPPKIYSIMRGEISEENFRGCT